MSNKTIDALNAAFHADPAAIHALIINRVPCNRMLADDQFVVVEHDAALPGRQCMVGALGLVNAVLAIHGQPLIAAKFDKEVDPPRLVGFQEYSLPPSPQDDAVESSESQEQGIHHEAWRLGEPNDGRYLTISLTGRAREEVERLKRETPLKTNAEIFSKALTLLRIYFKTEEEGGSVLLLRRDGQTSEVVLPKEPL